MQFKGQIEWFAFGMCGLNIIEKVFLKRYPVDSFHLTGAQAGVQIGFDFFVIRESQFVDNVLFHRKFGYHSLLRCSSRMWAGRLLLTAGDSEKSVPRFSGIALFDTSCRLCLAQQFLSAHPSKNQSSRFLEHGPKLRTDFLLWNSRLAVKGRKNRMKGRCHEKCCPRSLMG